MSQGQGGGRKPKPTVLKLLSGSREPINEHEPQPLECRHSPPVHLSPEATAKWEELAPRLERLGLLTEMDEDTFARYCSAWAIYIDAVKQVEEKGAVTVQGEKGKYINLSPHFTVMQRAEKELDSLMIEFGLTPSSRTRIGVLPRGAENNPARGDSKKAKAARILDKIKR